MNLQQRLLKTAYIFIGIVLAMQKKSGEILPNPSDEEIIESGDRFFCYRHQEATGGSGRSV